MTGRRSHDNAFVVQDASGTVLAVFDNEDVARRYADAGGPRTVVAAPVISETTLQTVHTRWLLIDPDGKIQSDVRDSYQWCAELDGDDVPPQADVEQYVSPSGMRLLGIGTDAGLIDAQVEVAHTAFAAT